MMTGKFNMTNRGCQVKTTKMSRQSLEMQVTVGIGTSKTGFTIV